MSELRRRLMMQQVSGGGPILPPEYQQVEYVQKPIGYIYIELPFKPISGHYKIKFQYIGSSNWGSLLWADVNFFPICTSPGSPGVIRDASGLNSIIYDNDIHIAEQDIIMGQKDGKCILDGEEKIWYVTNGEPNVIGNLFIGGNHRSNQEVRIYLFEYEGLSKLIPCYRKKDNVVGMYDKITNEFLSPTGGAFVAGPDVN